MLLFNENVNSLVTQRRGPREGWNQTLAACLEYMYVLIQQNRIN